MYVLNLFLYLLFALGQGVFSMVVDSIFATFAISFLVTRLIIFPRYLLSSLLFEAPRILGMWPGYWVFAGLLVCSYTYVRMYECMYVYMYVYKYVYKYVCMYVNFRAYFQSKFAYVITSVERY